MEKILEMSVKFCCYVGGVYEGEKYGCYEVREVGEWVRYGYVGECGNMWKKYDRYMEER